MKPPPFAYARPAALDEALELLAEAGEDAKLLAGGQSLLPLLGLRLARPTHLVDITRLPGLDAVEEGPDGGLAVGALVTHAQLERAAGIGPPWKALTESAALIGHYPIRVRGTAGGSFAHADPSAELPVVATALDAEIIVRSSTASRRIPVGEFFAGPFTTSLDYDEMVVRIEFPAPPVGRRSGFGEFATRHGDFATASVAVALTPDAEGRLHDVRIAVGAVGPMPLRAHQAENALEGRAPRWPDIVDACRLVAEVCNSDGDGQADLRFRRELVQVLVEQVLRRLEVAR